MRVSDLTTKGVKHLPLNTRRRMRHVLVKHLPRKYRPPVRRLFGVYAPWDANFDFTPRRTPGPGEVVGPPEFVGIGVPKAGTTRWHRLILAHPGVSRPAFEKELHYFSRFGSQPFRPADVDHYHGWFPRRKGALTGEWTPTYFSASGTAPLLKAAAPDTRLLLLLRDPVERLRLALNHSLVKGVPDGSSGHHIEQGFYDRYLDDWLGCFTAEQILILQYERCAADPENQLNATYRHLGLPDFRPAALDEGVGIAADTSIGLDPDVKKRLVAIYESDVLALAKRLPDLDLDLWPNFTHLTEGELPGPS